MKLVKVGGGIGMNELRRHLESLEGLTVKAGWTSADKYDANTPVAGIAAVQEFGSPSLGIPPARFMRDAVTNNSDKWSGLVGQQSERILTGKSSPIQAMELFGLMVQSDIVLSITNTTRPPLSPVTIALRKYRRDNPNAIVTRTLVNRVAAAIKAGKTGKGELGDQSFGNKTPLHDTGLMISSVKYTVDVK